MKIDSSAASNLLVCLFKSVGFNSPLKVIANNCLFYFDATVDVGSLRITRQICFTFTIDVNSELKLAFCMIETNQQAACSKMYCMNDYEQLRHFLFQKFGDRIYRMWYNSLRSMEARLGLKFHNHLEDLPTTSSSTLV